MCSNVYFFLLIFFCTFLCAASYHEQFRVPITFSDKLESYAFNEKEYVVQNLPVSWENAKILCRGQYNGTLAIVDTKEKAEFLAEALSESQLEVESVWVGARRGSADDPAGYRWHPEMELRRTAVDVYREDAVDDHYPMWLNRTRVPVPEGGADCVALERVRHDRPVFVDLQCLLERPFVCERDALHEVKVTELKTVRCRSGLYHVYNGRLNWHQAAAHCVLQKMSLANIGSMRCLRKLGTAMLKTRPSIENAWIGSRGMLGKWTWLDTGASLFQLPPYFDAQANEWPPMRDRDDVKPNGCMQLDRHATHPPVFMEARCERKMQFICYEGVPGLTTPLTPSDDVYSYVVVRQRLSWVRARECCARGRGALAAADSGAALLQLLLAMAEDRDQPINHIWLSGRLNMTKDASDSVTYTWYNPDNGKKIYDPMHYNNDTGITPYMLPWLDEDFTMDSPCLNLDRQDHLNGLVYGLPCDTPQYFICMIEKSKHSGVENITEGYDSA